MDGRWRHDVPEAVLAQLGERLPMTWITTDTHEQVFTWGDKAIHP